MFSDKSKIYAQRGTVRRDSRMISKDVVEGDFIDDAKKAKILIKLAEADKCLADSADEELQLMDVAAQTLLFYKN